MWSDEIDPSANRGSLVQVDAHRANVALARPVRVPDVRSAASSVLGATFTGHAARDAFIMRNAGTRRLGNSKGIEDPMFVPITLTVLVLVSLILSMVPCPGIGARAH
jgi:hypothetical protein